jgi:cullin 4
MFKTIVLSDPTMEGKLKKGISDLFYEDRQAATEHPGDVQPLIPAAISMVQELGLYESHFATAFSRSTEEYYTKIGDQFCQDLGICDYVALTWKLLEKESTRCDRYGVWGATKAKIIGGMQSTLVFEHSDVFTEPKVMKDLLVGPDMNTLERMYQLLKRVKLESSLKSSWETIVRQQGSEIVNDKERSSEMVTRLLELKTKLGIVCNGPFQKNESLDSAMRESFAKFINPKVGGDYGKVDTRPAEMISKYVDLLLRNGAKAIPGSLTSKAKSELVASTQTLAPEAIQYDDEAELSDQLDQVLELFRFVQGKDIFEAFYKKDLARRLLMGRSASSDAEKSMLTRLRNGKPLYVMRYGLANNCRMWCCFYA